MSSNNTNNGSNRSGGIGLFGAMFLLFAGLKLTDQIDWSWWLVAAPLWAPTLAVFTGVIVYAICKVAIDERKSKARR